MKRRTEITVLYPKTSILFLSFIHGISNFTVEGYVLNMYADNVSIYTAATSEDGEQHWKIKSHFNNNFPVV